MYQKYLIITLVIFIGVVGAVTYGVAHAYSFPGIDGLFSRIRGESQVAQIRIGPALPTLSSMSVLYDTCEHKYGRGYLLAGFDKNGIVCRKPLMNDLRVRISVRSGSGEIWYLNFPYTGFYAQPWTYRVRLSYLGLNSLPYYTFMSKMFPEGARSREGVISRDLYNDAIHLFLNGFKVTQSGQRVELPTSVPGAGLDDNLSLRQYLLNQGYINTNNYCDVKDLQNDQKICGNGDISPGSICRGLSLEDSDLRNYSNIVAMHVDCTKVLAP